MPYCVLQECWTQSEKRASLCVILTWTGFRKLLGCGVEKCGRRTMHAITMPLGTRGLNFRFSKWWSHFRLPAFKKLWTGTTRAPEAPKNPEKPAEVLLSVRLISETRSCATTLRCETATGYCLVPTVWASAVFAEALVPKYPCPKP